MSGKAKTRKTFGTKLKDQQNDNKTFYNLANQGTIMSSGSSVVTGGSIGGGTVLQGVANDLYMNTYDIVDLDRLRFAVKEGSGDALTATDYGIEAVYAGGNAYGMQFKIPATKLFYFNSGSAQLTYSDVAGLATGSNITGGSLVTGETMRTNQYLDIEPIVSPSDPSGTIRLFSDSDNTNHLTIRKSDGSEVDLETIGSGANQQLSNLSGTVAINEDLIPDSNKDLGSPTNMWKESWTETLYSEYIAGKSGTGNNILLSIGHINPFSANTYDLGDSVDYWKDLYIDGDIFFKGQTDMKFETDSFGIKYQVPAGDGHFLQVAGTTILRVYQTTVEIEAGIPIKSDAAGEIGFQVTDDTITIGSEGTMQIPYKDDNASQSTGSNSTLDSWFGNQNGCIGIQFDGSESAGAGKYRLWIRADSGWYRTEAY